ncbi:MAG: NAD+ synthase [Candidatus Protochlamydia sp.]|nr:NAD+ synthase [Candidatus Protochlamydia sp.]
MRIFAAQINPIIGDLQGNTQRILQIIKYGKEQNAELVLFPELALSGYPPEDFLLLPHFMESIEKNLEEIVQASKAIIVVVGLPRRTPFKGEKILHNSAAIIQDQKLLGYADKSLLPTYDVFDERRYFEPGGPLKVWNLNGETIGITICEDLWQHSNFIHSTHYNRDPVLELKGMNPTLLLNLSASPYSLFKFRTRLKVCLKAAKTLECPVILCNQVGGNDSLIFDGHSLVVNQDGLIHCAKGFLEDTFLIDVKKLTPPLHVEHHLLNDLYEALVLGVHDYFKKSGFKTACLGLSGGIDSALVASIAAQALGPQNVLAVYMPSRYSATESSRDAAQLAKKLNIQYQEISIEGPFESYLSLLAPTFANYPTDTTEENLQARIRGMLLMALSNKFGHIVLSTGNKSELAMGYATLYGDMCGGLGVVSDLTKQQIYALAEWINRHEEIIPWNTLKRAPTAELRLNQKDSDSLPDYEIIDTVLQAYVEEHQSPQWIAKRYGYPLVLVEQLVKRIHTNEYKRRQAPPGLRISERSFSVGRRFPIVQKWV